MVHRRGHSCLDRVCRIYRNAAQGRTGIPAWIASAGSTGTPPKVGQAFLPVLRVQEPEFRGEMRLIHLCCELSCLLRLARTLALQEAFPRGIMCDVFIAGRLARTLALQEASPRGIMFDVFIPGRLARTLALQEAFPLGIMFDVFILGRLARTLALQEASPRGIMFDVFIAGRLARTLALQVEASSDRYGSPGGRASPRAAEAGGNSA
jgi:hypothetical protein